jgi:hypothetical protein
MAGFLKRIHKIFRPKRKENSYDTGWLRDHMPHREEANEAAEIADPPREGETIDEYILRTATYVDTWSPDPVKPWYTAEGVPRQRFSQRHRRVIPLMDKSPIEFIRLKPFKFF